MSKNGNPFCSKLLYFAYRCQCKCKAKCSNYYILQRYYILGCDNAVYLIITTLLRPYWNLLEMVIVQKKITNKSNLMYVEKKVCFINTRRNLVVWCSSFSLRHIKYCFPRRNRLYCRRSSTRNVVGLSPTGWQEFLYCITSIIRVPHRLTSMNEIRREIHQANTLV